MKKSNDVVSEHYIQTETCSCGYKYSYDYDDKKVVEGTDEFIDVKVVATYEDKSDYYRQTRELNIVMCPVCGNLKGKMYN